MSRYGLYDYDDRGDRGPSADPNWRGGYRGMRMHGEGRGAPYGWHRMTHAGDLEDFGGFRGHGEPRVTPFFHRYDRDLRTREDRGLRGYDRALRDASGGAQRSLYDREYLRDFNSRSPGLGASGQGGRPGGQRYDRGLRPGRAGSPGGSEVARRGFDPEYANRGRGSGGYTDG